MGVGVGVGGGAGGTRGGSFASHAPPGEVEAEGGGDKAWLRGVSSGSASASEGKVNHKATEGTATGHKAERRQRRRQQQREQEQRQKHHAGAIRAGDAK